MRVLLVFLLALSAMATEPVGHLSVQGPDGPLSLRLIDPAEAAALNRGMVKIALPDGVTGAAELVPVDDPLASPVRISTPQGIFSWRVDRRVVMRIGSTDADGVTGMALGENGRVFLGGTTRSYSSRQDFIYVSLGADFVPEHSEVFTTISDMDARDITHLGNSECVQVGTCLHTDSTHTYLRYKYDSEGNWVWGWYTNYFADDVLCGVIPGEDSTIRVAGYTNSMETGDYDRYFALLGADGLITSSWVIGNDDDQKTYHLCQLSDGGTLLTGEYDRSDEPTACDITKVHGALETDWSWSISATGPTIGRAAAELASGDIAVTGSVYNLDTEEWDLFYYLTDSDGNLLTSHYYGNEDGDDLGLDITATQDGGCAMIGSTESYAVGTTDLWVIKMDASGLFSWVRFIGMTDPVAGTAIREDDQGILHLAGRVTNPEGNFDLLYLTMTPDGSTCLDQPREIAEREVKTDQRRNQPVVRSLPVGRSEAIQPPSRYSVEVEWDYYCRD